jgi:hypothetical protein
MSADGSSNLPRLELVGREAWNWLRERGPLGAHLLDFSVAALPQTFGSSRHAGALVPVDPLRGRRWDFFLAIEGRADRRRDWDELVRFEERLLDYLEGFAGPEKMMRLGRRFHPVLTAEPPAAVRLDAALDAWGPRG